VRSFTESFWCATAFIWLAFGGFSLPGEPITPWHATNGPPASNLTPPSPQNLTLHPSTADHPEEETKPGFSSPQPLLSGPANQAEDLVHHLLVVYNRNDPSSRDLAAYYATRRGIAEDHILSIACPTNEEISRSQYNETIREPIISYLSQKNWLVRRNEQVRFENRMLELLVATHNDIWAIVLIRGVPLKIAPDSSETDSLQPQKELATNAAAVDSELALLPIFGLPLGGLVPNAFFDGEMTGLHHAGPEVAQKVIFVARLDGPKPDDVRRMIDDSLYAEKNRLAGLAVIDARGITDVKDPYIIGDLWLRKARDFLAKDGWTVKFDDKEEVLPPTDSCNHVALYLGWYTFNAAGPWITPPNRFVRGAIAYHLHSYSATTVRSDTNAWVGPLIAHGAAATMGTVYEPYIDLTPHTDIFTLHLLAGDSFGEAAYASIKGLSWMTTVIGDPLYRPFRQPLTDALADKTDPDHHDWLLLQQVQRGFFTGEIPLNADALQHALDVPGTGAVAHEILGDLLEKSPDLSADETALKSYQEAMAHAAAPIDQIRIGLKIAQHYASHGQEEQAVTQLKNLRELHPEEAQRFGLGNPFVPVSTPAIRPVRSSVPTTALSPNLTPSAPPPKPPGPPGPPKP